MQIDDGPRRRTAHSVVAERAQITSNEYFAWTPRKAYMIYGAQAIAQEFVNSLKEFPPRQKPQSFNLDQILDQLQHPAEAD